MSKTFVFTNKHFEDLNPLFIGEEACKSGKSFGPAIRKYTLIHFVLSGKGTVHKQNATYEVRSGEAFIIFPNEVVTYTADKEDPWTYRWIAFNGRLSADLLAAGDIFSIGSGITDEIFDACNDNMCEHRAAGLLFKLYVDLLSPTRARQDYSNKVKDYVRALYMQPIKVEDIATQLNLDRRYLSRLFKQKNGLTIQEYIIKVRMNEAKRLLLLGETVERAARLSGYEDICNFSKMFKRTFGLSPLKWKKQNSQ